MDFIVLTHGYPGFVKIGRLVYFKDVADSLRAEGNVQIITPEVEPGGTIEARSRQLEKQIEKEFKGNRRHIIAHSVGGLDSRYLVSPQGLDRSDLVASLTTISTPHQGTSLAEIALRPRRFMSLKRFLFKGPTIDITLMKSTVGTVFRDLEDHADFLFGGTLARKRPEIFPSLKTTVRDASRYARRLLMLDDEGLKELTRDSMRDFNNEYKDAANVDYFSYAGASGPGENDILPPILYLSHLIVLSKEGRNDGWISVKSATRDEFKGELPADHAQQIGHDLSLISRVGFRNRQGFDHLQFYKRIMKEVTGSPRVAT